MNCEAIMRPNGGGRGSQPTCGKPATYVFVTPRNKLPLCGKCSRRPFYKSAPVGTVKKIAEKALPTYAKA